GNGFNYNGLPDPTAPDNIDKPGGRGVFLMKALSDELEFLEEGRKIRLSFYLD
ncbi:MAG: serine/threonine-protein kinase RsbW, partial [Marivirga sp.]